MSKKRNRRKRKHKKRTKNRTAIEPSRKESITNKKRKKFLSCLPILFLVLIISLYFFLPRKSKIIKNSNLNVLLITIDTLRADRLGYSGYDIETPNIDSLAYKGARFINAVCQVPLTLPSHASILTGTNPPFHGIKVNGSYYLKDEFITLAEVLKERGYQTAAFVGSFSVDSRFGLNQGFDFYDDNFEIDETRKELSSERRAEKVFSCFKEWFLKNYNNKFFVWIHYFDPHTPYSPPPPFSQKYKERLYDGEIAYTDLYVGKLINLLKGKNVYKRTLIILVSDHGEGLGEHGESIHGFFLYDSTLQVPLIFHCPSIIPDKIEIKQQVRTIDIFPTVLDILGLKIPDSCQGNSLIPLMEGRKSKEFEESYAETYFPLIQYGWSGLKAIRTSEWKFIEAPQPELYNLKRDPLEKNNLIWKKRTVAKKLRKKLEELEKEISLSQKISPVRKMTLEEQERLSALGYLGGNTNFENNQELRPDPKDKLHIFEKTLQVNTALMKGKLNEAEQILKEMMNAEEYKNPMIRHYLGVVFLRKGEVDRAIKEFREAININPDDLGSHFKLAECYFKKGELDKAIQEAEVTLNIHPYNIRALLILTDIYTNKGRYDKALEYIEKAVNIEPQDKKLRLRYANALALVKNYDEAFREYNYLLEKTPNDPILYNGIGVTYFFMNDFENAIKYLLKEIELHFNPDSYYLLGLAYGRLNKYSKAVKYLEKYVSFASRNNLINREKAQKALNFFKSKLE